MSDYVESKNMSLIDLGKVKTKKKTEDVVFSVCFHLNQFITALNLELVSLTNDVFAKQGINFSDDNIKELLRKVKADLPEEYKTLNGAELLKLIRCSIAHNSEENPNVTTSLIQHMIKLTKKGIDTPAESTFSSEGLINLNLAYDRSRDLEKTYGYIETEEDLDTVDKFLKAHKKHGTFAKFVKVCDEKGNEQQIDSYQESALLRFLIKHKHNINKYGDFSYFLIRYFPNKENNLNVYEQKSRLFSVLSYIMGDRGTPTCEDVVKIVKQNEPQAILPFVDQDLMKSLIYSSLMFNMVSSRTNEELKEIFNEAQLDIDPKNVRHVRNSFIHGRYFFNFKDSFELYDGYDGMEHFVTLSFADIEKIFEVFCKEEILKLKIDGFLKSANGIIIT